MPALRPSGIKPAEEASGPRLACVRAADGAIGSREDAMGGTGGLRI